MDTLGAQFSLFLGSNFLSGTIPLAHSHSDSSLLVSAPSKPIEKHIHVLQLSSISKISVYNVSLISFMSYQH